MEALRNCLFCGADFFPAELDRVTGAVWSKAEDDLRLEFLNAEVTKAVGLAFFSVVLDPDDAAGVLAVFNVGGDDSVDFDLEAITLAGNTVGVPVVAFEGVAGAFGEGGFAFFVISDGADEPLAATFVVESTGPVALGAIDFGLVAEDIVGFDIGAEHEAAVGLSGREEDVAFEDEVGVGLVGDEEEFFVSGEVEFTIDDFDLSPVVGIVQTVGGLAVEEGGPFVGGRGIDGSGFFLAAVGEGEGSEREKEEV